MRRRRHWKRFALPPLCVLIRDSQHLITCPDDQVNPLSSSLPFPPHPFHSSYFTPLCFAILDLPVSLRLQRRTSNLIAFELKLRCKWIRRGRQGSDRGKQRGGGCAEGECVCALRLMTLLLLLFVNCLFVLICLSFWASLNDCLHAYRLSINRVACKL